MPIYPDRDTLRLRAPDRRTPAEAARVVARELARRPAATRWDVSLSPPDRALAMFRENYSRLAERFPAGVLWSAAHGHAQAGARSTRRPCGWCLARAYARQQQQPAPRVDQLGLALLGPACATCDPPPRPKPKPARSTRAARSSTSRTRRPVAAELIGLTAAARAPRPVAPDTPYNRAAAARMHRQTGSAAFTPARMGWPATPPARRGRR
jgi:hypothetical protein